MERYYYVPGTINVDDSTVKPDSRAVQPIPLTKRKHFANFLGRGQGKLQSSIYPGKLKSPELRFSGAAKLGRIDYFKHLRNAKFCLAPRGLYESFFVTKELRR